VTCGFSSRLRIAVLAYLDDVRRHGEAVEPWAGPFIRGAATIGAVKPEEMEEINEMVPPKKWEAHGNVTVTDVGYRFVCRAGNADKQ
jgi:hypothetical protein